MDVLVPVCGGWGVPIEDPDRISYSIQGNISFRAPVVPSSPLSPSVSASKPQSTLPVLASSRKLGRGAVVEGCVRRAGPTEVRAAWVVWGPMSALSQSSVLAVRACKTHV